MHTYTHSHFYNYIHVYTYARRHGNPFQYSCLENPQGQRSLVGSMGVTKSWT